MKKRLLVIGGCVILAALCLLCVGCEWPWNSDSPTDPIEANDCFYVGTVISESGVNIGGGGSVVVSYPAEQLVIQNVVVRVLDNTTWEFTCSTPYKPGESLMDLRAVPAIQPQPDLGHWVNPVWYEFATRQYRATFYVQ